MNLIKSIGITAMFYLAPHLSGMDLTRNNSPENIFQFPDTSINGITYVSASLLEHLLENKVEFLPDRNKFLIKDPAGTIWRITPDNPYLSVGQEIYNLTQPVIKGYRHLFIPLDPLLSLFGELYNCGITHEKSDQGLIIENDCIMSKAGPNIIKIDHHELRNGSIVEIFLKERLPYHTLWVAPHYIINLQNGELDPGLLEKQQFKGLVKSISTIQEDSLAQVTLYIPRAIDTVEAAYSEEFNKLSLLIRSPVKKNEPAKNTGALPLADIAPKTVIIDPGHGGKDPGAAFKGVYEKDIVLKIAKDLEKNLTKKGYKVLLTRDKDEFISLTDRPKFAARHGGDLFISLHCNAIEGSPKRLKDINGFAAYILREGESEEDNALARRENKAVLTTKNKENKTQISPVEWILLEHELNLYSHQSELFAEKIVNNFESGPIKKHRTGAHQAGFFVLVGTFMPAVLYEIGFITNEEDRRYMTSSRGQKDIAIKLSKSIQDFFNSVPKQ